MFQDFTIETLEHTGEPFKGKKGDFIMIGSEGEMYVQDGDTFRKNYEVKGFWSILSYAKSSEDYHEGTVCWNDTPFNDEAMKLLEDKKQSKL